MPRPSANPDLDRLRAARPALEARQRLLRCIRGFFEERDFLEAETPLRIPAPAIEDYIDAEPAGSWFLRTSPELHMKRLLAAGYPRLFQLGPCFRQGECGTRHQPEFCMLEWYRADSGCDEILADTAALVRAACRAVTGERFCRHAGHTVNVESPWEELTVDAAFAKFAGRTPEEAMAAGEFEHDIVAKIEPRLGLERPCVLRNYPLPFGGLARRCPERPDRAERWELYIGGLEIANAYSELTDPAEQTRRFAESAEIRRRDGRTVYPMDRQFMDALASGMPPSGGIALGVDRLLMTLTGATSIAEVVAFPHEAK